MTTQPPTAKQEAEWAAHKAACFARWREEKLTKALAWVSASEGFERHYRLSLVDRKYGSKFRGSLEKLMRGKK